MGLSLRRALDAPDADLVAAFGEDILPERDALVATIRESLDAEGLTGTRQDEPAAPLEGEAAPAAAEGTPAPAPSVAPIDPIAAFEERQQRAEEAAAASRAARQARQNRQQQGGESRSAYEDSDMSAMALAFAQAGGAEELLAAVDETPKQQRNRQEPKRKPEPVAEAKSEPVTEAESAAEPVADAAPEPVVAKEAIEPVSAEAAAEPVEAESEAAPVAEAASAKPASTRELGPAESEGTEWVAGTGENAVPEGFPIKGNASSRIYHPAESPSYERTIAEVYFASPEAAEAAGYRLPKGMQHAGEAAADAVTELAEQAAKAVEEA
jgi:hypothetical protein